MKAINTKISALLLIVAILFFTGGCKEDYYDPYYKAPSIFTGVPDGFDWSTVSSVNLTVNVNDEYNGQYNYLIEVFQENPVFGGDSTLLAKGSAKKGQAFTTEVTFPQATSVLYVRQTAPNGLQIVQERSIDSKDLTVDFAGTTSTKSAVKRYAVVASEPSPQGDRNAATTIDLSTNSTTLTAGKSYVITGGTYGGKLVYNGSDTQTTTLFVEGEWNIPSGQSSFQNGLEIVVLNGGKISFKGNSYDIQAYNGVNIFIMQGGIFNSDKKGSTIAFSDNAGNLYNFGELYTDQISINGGTFYNNSRTANVSLISGAGKIENHGLLTAGTITSTYGLTIDNYCYTNVSGTITSNGSTFILRGSSNLSCLNLVANGTTFNMEPFAIFNVSGQATFGSWGSIFNGTGTGSDFALARMKKVVCNGYPAVTYSGNLELECSTHTKNVLYSSFYVINNPAHIVAYDNPTVSVPAGDCTGTGSTPQTTQPANPNYPIEVTSGTMYTYAIEDLWPAYGDYDMNDVVVETQTTYLMDYNNKVTGMTINATLVAVGAEKKIAAAIQLDRVLASSITSMNVTSDASGNRLTGDVFTLNSAGLETGQTYAVIPLFDEAHRFLLDKQILNTYTLNTYNDGTSRTKYIEPKNMQIKINFKSNTVNPIDISIKYRNFFIVTNAQKTDRMEIHLAGYAPTQRATTALFGGGPTNIPSNNDLSLNGTYYLGTDNLVWGLMIPGTFYYPNEYVSILKAYPKFADWATSGGTSNQDWYNYSNANTINLYSK